MMGLLMADFPDKKSTWGPKILTHLRGEAERMAEDISRPRQRTRSRAHRARACAPLA